MFSLFIFVIYQLSVYLFIYYSESSDKSLMSKIVQNQRIPRRKSHNLMYIITQGDRRYKVGKRLYYGFDYAIRAILILIFETLTSLLPFSMQKQIIYLHIEQFINVNFNRVLNRLWRRKQIMLHIASHNMIKKLLPTSKFELFDYGAIF